MQKYMSLSTEFTLMQKIFTHTFHSLAGSDVKEQTHRYIFFFFSLFSSFLPTLSQHNIELFCETIYIFDI